MSGRSTRSGAGAAGKGTKRARTDGGGQPPQFKREGESRQPNNNNQQQQQQQQQQQPSLGRPQLLLATDELRKRTGKKYCDESELLPLLLAQGLVRRVRTIAVEVRPLSGDSFDIRVDARRPTVGEAKAEIEREQGTKKRRQLLVRRYYQRPFVQIYRDTMCALWISTTSAALPGALTAGQ